MSETQLQPAYRILTHRLLIRCWDPADAPLVERAVQANLEHLRPWMPWINQEPEPLEEKIARLRRFRSQFDRDESYIYGIFNPEETRVLGGTGLHPRTGPGGIEIGYWIDKDFINRGLATETSVALIKVAFEIHKVRRVEIHCDPHNIRSAAVPRKLGFIHEATLRQRLTDGAGGWADEMFWTLFEEDYPKSPAYTTEIQAFDAAGRRLI
jgi:RimJ/RimL family protein N-acetyltransferase